MKLRNDPALHLTYCMNVHPAETWADTLEAVRTAACSVKERVAPSEPFGLGLRLSCDAARSLTEPGAVDRFSGFLGDHGLYVFTVNGFPYGPFHGQPVKEAVYAPDWRTPERLAYTLRLADILARLIPEGERGSISTVPCSYRAWIKTKDDTAAVVRNLVDCADHLAGIRERAGREIHVGLEPELDCFIETTGEAVTFFTETLAGEGVRYLCRKRGWSPARAEDVIRRHLGVCFDTCHMAVRYEDLAASIGRLQDSGVLLSKVQLSAALATRITADTCRALRDFSDPVYLHQVKLRDRAGRVRSYGDLADFLEAGTARIEPGTECRVHCHVPLYFTDYAGLKSTAPAMTDDFFTALLAGNGEHLEIETYTFTVLPPDLRTLPVTESIANEYHWVLDRVRQLL